MITIKCLWIPNADRTIVTCDFDIRSKNRHHAKVLSTSHQVKESNNLLFQKHLQSYSKEKQLYDMEENEDKFEYSLQQIDGDFVEVTLPGR